MALFTTNLVGHQLPDLYIAELSPPRRVVGVGTGVVAVIGEFQKGPTDTSITIGSLGAFVETFGGPGPDVNGNSYKGYTALMNKGWQDLRVVRVSNSGQAVASYTLVSSDATPNNLMRADAGSTGYYGNGIKIEVTNGTNPGTKRVVIINERGSREPYDNVDISTTPKLNEFVNKVSKVGTIKLTGLQAGTLANGTFTLVGGSDGSFANGDYIGSINSERGLRVLERIEAVNIVFIAENGAASTQSAVQELNAAVLNHCNGQNNRIGIICGLVDDTIPIAKENAEEARGDRVAYTFPFLETYDADNNESILVAPNSFVAAKVASLSPHVSPSNKQLGAVTGLSKNLTRAECVELTEAGIMCISFVTNGGYRIRNGRMTELFDTGRWQMFRRRMTDYIQIALAKSLNWAISEPHTKELRRQIRQSIIDFLAELESLGMIGDPNGVLPAYNVVCDVTNNPPSVVAAGKLYCDVRVRLIAAADFIIIRTEIGEGVITSQVAA